MTTSQAVAKREPVKQPPKKGGRDWLTIGAIGAGAAALGFGLWMFYKKEGVKPGGDFMATLNFKYTGDQASYVLQVRLGWMILGEPLAWFNPSEGMKWTLDIDLPGPGDYEFDIECRIPEGADPGTYDAEAQIKEPGSDESQYIIRDLDDNAILVAKP